MSKPHNDQHDTATPNDPIDHLINIAKGTVDDPEFDREHRTYKRRPYEHTVWFVECGSGEHAEAPIPLRCRNISAGGLNVFSRTMLTAGGDGAVLLPRSDGEPALVGARVVYCNFVDQQRCEVGMEFIEVPEGITLDSFCDAHGQLPATESTAA